MVRWKGREGGGGKRREMSKGGKRKKKGKINISFMCVWMNKGRERKEGINYITILSL